jgi:hypothetical protein
MRNRVSESVVRTGYAVACCAANVPMTTADGAYYCIAVWISGYEYFRTIDRTGQLKLDVTGMKGFSRLTSLFSIFK